MKCLLTLRRRLRATKGGAIVEFAFMFPILLSLIGGVADFGIYLWQRGRLANAVTYGTQYAFLIGTATGANANIKSAVTSVAAASLTGTTITRPVAEVGPPRRGIDMKSGDSQITGG